jgi:hypothetical protein
MAMADMLSCWQWKVEPVSPAGFPDLDSEATDAWGLFEDEEVQQQKQNTDTTYKPEKPSGPTRAEVASKLLEDLDEWIKEGTSYLVSSINSKCSYMKFALLWSKDGHILTHKDFRQEL